ncbi:GPP34 family phosphoprotein, partial [Streptomyces sp. NPDC007095]
AQSGRARPLPVRHRQRRGLRLRRPLLEADPDAAAGGLRSVVSREDQKTFRARIDACTGHLAALAPGLEKAVRALPMTMIAAQGGMGGS